MKNNILIFVLSFSYLITFCQYKLQEGYLEVPTENDTIQYLEYKKLRLYPLRGGVHFRKAHAGLSDYTNLQKALNEEKVIITEAIDSNARNIEIQNINNAVFLPDTLSEETVQQQVDQEQVQQGVPQQQLAGVSAQVNKLFIENISEDTVFIMAGEVIKGGKQDRVIEKDIILPPLSGKIDISVFCVEHHRWSFKTTDGKFNEYYSVSANSVRQKAAVNKNQQEVWDAVDKITSKQEARTGTGTYAALDSSEKYVKERGEYLEYFNKELDKMEHCIGFVGVSGDSIIGCDLFATEALFKKQQKNLLNAYVTEALTYGKAITIRQSEIDRYLNHLFSDETKQEDKIKQKGVLFEHQGKKIHINTY
jgi:hypothetical protein